MTATNRAPAWGDGVVLDEDEARQRLLSAAEACYAERGPSRTKMTHIAAKAGVHRTTVYSYFPNRDAILAACFMRAIEEVMAAVNRCFEADMPFVERVITATVTGVEIGRKSPALQSLISANDLTWTHRAVEHSESWRQVIYEVLGDRIAEAAAAGEVRADVAPQLLAHWMGRIAFSLLAEPGPPEYGGDEGLLRAILPAMFAP
ncbi:TetR/AcrR family transcriptional regulator [Mycolicibacterium sp. XJ1819]